MQTTKTLFIWAVCLFSVSFARKPHIIYILADDYGWNDIGYHGSEIRLTSIDGLDITPSPQPLLALTQPSSFRTPTLDNLAARGVKLNNYYVQPICTPSRSQLLSGRYQIHTGLQHSIIHAAQPNGLPLDLPTIADVVKRAGYSTHMVGKWHLGFYKRAYTPLRRGFDSFFGYLGGSENYYTHHRCYKKHVTHKMCGLDLRNNFNAEKRESGKYSTELFTKKAKDIISYHGQYKREKPMFLYLPYQAVHIPLQAPRRYVDMNNHIFDRNRRIYAGMVSCMDEAVRNITRQLRASGMWDDTVLIFSTDNGGQSRHGASNYPLRGSKGTLYEGGVRGVGFVSCGKNIRMSKRGSTSRQLMHITDWFPTIAHLAGADVSSIDLDGYNVWDSISEGRPSARKEILHNIDPMRTLRVKDTINSVFDVRVRSAIRVGDWKLITGDSDVGIYRSASVKKGTVIVDEDGSLTINDKAKMPRNDYLELIKQKGVLLFNIEQDPNENNELSYERPDVVMRLLRRLHHYNRTAVPVRFPANDDEADPKYHGGVWSPWMW